MGKSSNRLAKLRILPRARWGKLLWTVGQGSEKSHHEARPIMPPIGKLTMNENHNIAPIGLENMMAPTSINSPKNIWNDNAYSSRNHNPRNRTRLVSSHKLGNIQVGSLLMSYGTPEIPLGGFILIPNCKVCAGKAHKASLELSTMNFRSWYPMRYFPKLF